MAIVRDKATGRLFGVTEEAKRLNVSKGHLWLVLNGKRQSKRLLKRVHLQEFDSREAK